MKKTCIRVIVVILAALCAFSAVSCGGSEPVGRGELDRRNHSYTNETIGMSFTLAEGWLFSGDSTVAEMVPMPLEDYQKADIFEDENVRYIIPFSAYEGSTGNSITFSLEKRSSLTSANTYISELIDALRLQYSEYTNITVDEDSDKVEICGKKWECVTVKLEYGYKPSNQYILVRRYGTVFAAIIIMDIKRDDRQYYLDMFSEYTVPETEAGTT